MAKNTEKVKKPKEEVKEKNKDTSALVLDQYLKTNKEDHLNFEPTFDWTVSTGSLLFDVELGGGFKPGCIKLHGSSFGGKSSCTGSCVKNFLETLPNAKAIWFDAEGRLSQVKERTGIKFVTKTEDWVAGTCYVIETNIFEFVVDLINNLIRNNPTDIKYAIVIDSLDDLIRREDMQKEAKESEKVGAAGLLLSTMFKKAGLVLNKKGHVLFALGQVRAKVETSKFAPKDMNKNVGGGGANALTHAANVVWKFEPRYKTNDIIEDGKLVGHWCNIVATKGVKEAVDVAIKYPIKHGRTGGKSVWVEYELTDLLMQWEMISKSGAWISLGEDLSNELKEAGLIDKEDKIMIQGDASFKNWLEENPAITDYLYRRFLKLITI